MKKALKRSLSLLLAITIIMGSAYAGLSEVDLGRGFGVNASAKTNHTKDEAIAWIKARGNENWWQDVDGAYGCQCVDLIMAYYTYLVGYRVSGNAKDYLNTSKLPSGWTMDSTPTPGSIIVWGGNTWTGQWTTGTNGHVGLVYSVSGSNVYTVETNTGSTNGQGDAAAAKFRTRVNVGAKYIHPDFNGTTVAPLTTPTITFNKSYYTKGDTITISWPASPADSLSHYWISVYNPDGNMVINEMIDKSNTSYSFVTPGVGTYDVKIFATPYNSASGEGSLTDTKSVSIYTPLATPQITFDKASYEIGDTITVSWVPSPADSNLSHYWISVYNPDGNMDINEMIDKSNTSFSFTTPGVGTYDVKIFATPYNSASGEGSLTDTKSITINPKPQTFTITYDANGGIDAPPSQTKTYGQVLVLTNVIPIRSGYIFLGWSTSCTSTEATYFAGRVFTIDADTTLYAVWERVIQEKPNTVIDYENLVIRTYVENCGDIEEILELSDTVNVTVIASQDNEIYGTGTIITVFDGNEYIGDFTLVVDGDTNGDSVCDALDAAQVALVSNGQKTIDGAYAMAADSNSDNEISIVDYQAIVNKVVA